MKAKGPRNERETTITFNEEEETAHIWTAFQPVYRMLKKLGYEPVEDTERSARFEVPKKRVRIRKRRDRRDAIGAEVLAKSGCPICGESHDPRRYLPR